MAETPIPTQLARDIHNLSNSMTSGGENLHLLAELLVNDHRTLQQSLMRDLIWPLLKLWAEDFEAGRYDARNEATVRFAHEAIDSMRDAPAFPFI